MEQNYKDIVIEQLSYRIADLENFAKKLLEENKQLKERIAKEEQK